MHEKFPFKPLQTSKHADEVLSQLHICHFCVPLLITYPDDPVSELLHKGVRGILGKLAVFSVCVRKVLKLLFVGLKLVLSGEGLETVRKVARERPSVLVSHQMKTQFIAPIELLVAVFAK